MVRPATQPAPILAALSREALDLLGVVLRERPATIAGRAQSNVSRSLQQLVGHGLVRLVRQGREVGPEPIACALRVELATVTYETTPVLEAAA